MKQFVAIIPWVLFLLSQSAHGDELMNARVFHKKGDAVQALDQLDAYLSTRPVGARGQKIAQAWFLKGLILAEQNKTAEAMQSFSVVIKDYPEYPEPYNNLAVLYAKQGQYEKARATLEAAIATHPAYAVAHENLGEVYEKLAGLAYEKAVKMGKSAATPSAKSAQVKQLCNDYDKIATQALQINKISPAGQFNLIKELHGNGGKLAKPPVNEALLSALPAAPTASPVVAPVVKNEQRNTVSDEEILQTVNAWAAAWSKKSVKAYFSYYAKTFKPADGESRSVWERTRRERIRKPEKILVGVDLPRVSLDDSSHASVSFAQRYRSDSLQISTRKTLVLEKKGGRWLIVREHVAK